MEGKKTDDEILRLMAQEGPSEDPAGKKRKRRRLHRLAAAAVVLAVAAGGTFLAFANRGEETPRVAVTNPVRKDIRSTLTISGPISGTDSVDVVSSIHAEILQIPVAEGDRVKKGQVIAVLDDTDLKREVEIVKNSYDLAVSTYEEKDREAKSGYAKAVQDLKAAQDSYDRTKILFDGGSVPRVDLEAAQAALDDAVRTRDSFTIENGKAVAAESYLLQVEAAKLQYEKSLKQIDETVITAPIDGTLVRVNTKVGRFADRMEDNTPLFEIMNLDMLEMKVQISEYSIGKVAVGQEAEISADILNGRTVRGQVISISPTGEEKDGSSTERVVPTTICIMDDGTDLIAGITARAKIILETAENALTVPVSAVTQTGDETYIQTVRDGAIHKVPVTVGVESDVALEIIPAEGETVDEQTQVLVTPDPGLAEGTAAEAVLQ